MFRPTEINNEFANLLGWRQDYDPENYIGSELTASVSGQYYQDIHPLATLDNLRAIAPRFNTITYPDWNSATTYRKGEIVTYSEKTYRAIGDNTNKQPDSSTDEWGTFDAFTQWLEEKTQASTLKALQSIFSKKLSEKTAMQIVEQKTLFDGTGRIKDVIENKDYLVGFELVPLRSRGVVLKIESIGLQFTGKESMTMYLMHSSRNEIIKEITLVRDRDGGMQWFAQDELYLPYESADTDSGGSWYLCYKQSDLPDGVEAVNKERDLSQSPCYSCSSTAYQDYKAWSKYLEVHPFRVSDIEDGELTMWDINDNIHTYSTNYGINLQVTVECDITGLFTRNKLTFQDVIGLQMAYDVVKELAFNSNDRVSRSTELKRAELLYELEGTESKYYHSLAYKLKQAIEACSIDMTGMSRVCMKCGKKGVKYKPIG